MRTVIIAFALVFLGLFPARAEGEAQITLPFNLELNRPITFEVTYTAEMSGVSFGSKEMSRLTAIKHSDDGFLFEGETLSAEMTSAEGFPPHLEALLAQLLADASEYSIEFTADNTGYPLEITKSGKLKSFMKKVNKGLKKWAKKFAKSEKLSADQRVQMQALIDEFMAPYLAGDAEALNRMALEQGELIFNGTGRALFVDYYTETKTTRYFEDGETYFHTVDSWELVSYDEENGEAVIRYTQALNGEEFAGFLGRYRDILEEQNGPELQPQVDALVKQYEGLQLNREGEYVIDLTSGLPKSGRIRSEQIFNGASEVEIIEFTSTY